MLSSPELIGPAIGLCSFSCGITSYLGCKSKKISKAGWIFVCCNVAAFLYLNYILFIDLIQRVADTNDGYINVFDNDFAPAISMNLIQIIIVYIISSVISGYQGTKEKFKVNDLSSKN